ncbi:unnamed protein product [Mytilus coruscus]|uniref:Tyr recombinase domain-containing protein n=1 Tax=Mytilus coruscus TaxID=42192 RepID=A0A6J8E2J9_MYTCO|nr:unnamed protein product [Mytilus coruscus]
MGPLKLDLFADRLNAQLDNYISCAIQIDAFQVNWSNKNPYAFSPFCLIARCITKVNKERSNLVIIIPAWQSQAFYPMLLEMSISTPLLLPQMRDLLTNPQGGTHPLIENKTFKLVAWKVSGLSESQLLVSGWRKGTESSYNSCWRHWDRWCCGRDLDPFQAPVESITNFIAYLFQSGYDEQVVRHSETGHDYMNVLTNEIIFTIVKLTKTRKTGSQPYKITFSSFPENDNLNVVQCILDYIDKTVNLRSNECNQLLISFIKPHKPVKSCTIAHWLKRILESAGIYTDIFKPHSTRGASTSKANKFRVSTKQIMNTANWRSRGTFEKFYHKPLETEIEADSFR